MNTDDLYAKAEKRKRWFLQARGLLGFLIILALVAAMLVTSLLAYNIDHRGRSNSPVLREIRTGNQILIDCTTPGHDCYEQGQQRTGEAIVRLNQIIVLASYCAKQPGNVTVEQIQACVVKGLR